MLGGAFRRGQKFSVNARELFDSLTSGERQLIKDYLVVTAKKTKEKHPELVAQFPRVFEGLS